MCLELLSELQGELRATGVLEGGVPRRRSGVLQRVHWNVRSPGRRVIDQPAGVTTPTPEGPVQAHSPSGVRV